MDQSIKPKPATDQPTLQDQINFIKRLRTQKLVIRSVEHPEMWKVIEENLRAVKLWNATFIKTLEEGSEVDGD